MITEATYLYEPPWVTRAPVAMEPHTWRHGRKAGRRISHFCVYALNVPHTRGTRTFAHANDGDGQRDAFSDAPALNAWSTRKDFG